MQLHLGGGLVYIVAASRLAGDYLAHILGEDEAQVAPYIGRNILQIGLVAFGQDDGPDARAVGGQHLFLDSAHRQDLAPQGDLAGHGEVLDHAPLR